MCAESNWVIQLNLLLFLCIDSPINSLFTHLLHCYQLNSTACKQKAASLSFSTSYFHTLPLDLFFLPLSEIQSATCLQITQLIKSNLVMFFLKTSHFHNWNIQSTVIIKSFTSDPTFELFWFVAFFFGFPVTAFLHHCAHSAFLRPPWLSWKL